MEELSIYDYLDYRDFLRDHYKIRKSESSIVSFRFIGDRIDVDPSYLAKVFMKQKHLSSKTIPAYAELLKLDEKATRYFESMVLFAKASTNAESAVYFEQMLALRQGEGALVTEDQYEFYKTWRHSAVRQALECFLFDGTNESAFAHFIEPEITVEQLRESIELLTRLNLIAKNESGRYIPQETTITTGEIWKNTAVHSFQDQTIELSHRALNEITKELRDISTLTFSLPVEEIGLIKEKIREFRSSIIRYANQVESFECVYQLNMQLFPLTKVGNK